MYLQRLKAFGLFIIIFLFTKKLYILILTVISYNITYWFCP